MKDKYISVKILRDRLIWIVGASNEDDKLTTKVISNNYENLATSEKVLIETVHFFKMICSVHCFEQ